MNIFIQKAKKTLMNNNNSNKKKNSGFYYEEFTAQRMLDMETIEYGLYFLYFDDLASGF